MRLVIVKSRHIIINLLIYSWNYLWVQMPNVFHTFFILISKLTSQTLFTPPSKPTFLLSIYIITPGQASGSGLGKKGNFSFWYDKMYKLHSKKKQFTFCACLFDWLISANSIIETISSGSFKGITPWDRGIKSPEVTYVR